MESICVGNKKYYEVAALREEHPELFTAKQKRATQEELLKNLNCEESDTFIGVKSGKTYVESNSKRSKYFVSVKFVKDKLKNIDTMVDENVIPDCPKIIDLSEKENFTDADGNMSNIVTVGERKCEKCFFCLTMSWNFLDYLRKNITSKML